MAARVAVPAGPAAAPAVSVRSVTARAAIVCRRTPSTSRRAATIAPLLKVIVPRVIVRKATMLSRAPVRKAIVPMAPARMPTVPTRPARKVIVRKATARSAARRVAVAAAASAVVAAAVAEVAAAALPEAAA